MLATVVWIGALAALALLILPIARHSLTPEAYHDLLTRLHRRLDPVAWFSLVLLVVTGLIQMAANPNYDGFLAVNNSWAVAILAKHLVFGGMIATSAYMTWKVLPDLRHLALRRAKGLDDSQGESLRKQEMWLLRLNLVLSVVILALTALARTA